VAEVSLSQQGRKEKQKKNKNRPSPVRLSIPITSHTWPHPHDALDTTNYTDLNNLQTTSVIHTHSQFSHYLGLSGCLLPPAQASFAVTSSTGCCSEVAKDLWGVLAVRWQERGQILKKKWERERERDLALPKAKQVFPYTSPDCTEWQQRARVDCPLCL
jgi:hypothetical protein